MTLYHHGIITVSPIDGFHAFNCPHCLALVKTSISVTISLSANGHFTVLSNHYRRKSCIARHARNESHSAQTALGWLNLNSVPSTPTGSTSSLLSDLSDSLTLPHIDR